MIVMGLDLSLKSSGVMVLDTELRHSIDVEVGSRIWYSESIVFKPNPQHKILTKSGKSKTLSDRQKIERLVAIRDRIFALCCQYGPEHVAIEGYAFSKHSSSVTGLAELGGAVRVMLFESMGIIPATIPVGQCRKFVVGSGKATKDQTRKFLAENGLEFDTEDEADAYVMAVAMSYAVDDKLRGALDLDKLAYLDNILATVAKRGDDYE